MLSRLHRAPRINVVHAYFSYLSPGSLNATSFTSLDSQGKAVEGLLTNSSDPTELLKDTLKSNPDCMSTHILLSCSLLRQGSPANISKIAVMLQRLDKSHRDGKLSKNEQLWSAAVRSWFTGRYLRAGALFESVIALPHLQMKANLLAMRLAQDCYLLAGSTENALGCVRRHASDPNAFYTGLLHRGMLENNRSKSVEVEIENNMHATKGKNALALTLAQTHCLVYGNASTAISLVGQYGDKHTGLASVWLLYHKGWAQVQRGQLGAAYRAVEYMMETLAKEYPAPQTVPRAAYNPAIMLLWLAFVQGAPTDFQPHVAMELLKTVLGGHRELPASQDLPSDITNSVLVAMLRHMIRMKKDDDANVAEEQPPTEPKEFSLYDSIKNWMNPGYTRANDPEAVERDRVAAAQYAVDLTAIGGALDAMEKAHRDNLACKELLSRGAEASVFDQVEPVVNFVRHHCAQGQGQNDLVVGRRKCSLVLHKVLCAFCEGKPLLARDVLHSCRDMWPYLGGEVSLWRDLLNQTQMEILMHCGDLDLLYPLLMERISECPADTHAYRRLSVVESLRGNEEGARRVAYLAYQNGLNQGGLNNAWNTRGRREAA